MCLQTFFNFKELTVKHFGNETNECTLIKLITHTVKAGT